jgi:hypothetical protein
MNPARKIVILGESEFRNIFLVKELLLELDTER